MAALGPEGAALRLGRQHHRCLREPGVRASRLPARSGFRWLANFSPGMRVKVWSGNELETICGRIGEADLHVINYAQLRSVGEGLARVSFLAVILDEGQFIKNPSSATAKFARALRAAHRLVLSGTPIENRLMDLWSLMAFAMPGVLGGRADFGKLYGDKEDPLARRRLSATTSKSSRSKASSRRPR